MQRVLVDNAQAIRLVVDSGAFTAWKLGTPVGLDDYCRFLESLPVRPWRYFTLDVVGDPVGTRRNYEVMRARGFTPVPIFTRGEQLASLDEYFTTSDVVGVGGLVGTHRNKAFLNAVQAHTQGARKLHWLGFGNINYLRAYRPYMCDSTTCFAGRYGRLRVYMGRGRIEDYGRDDYRMEDQLAARIRQFGEEPAYFMRRDAWHNRGALMRLNATSAVALSLDLQRVLGTLFFQAATGTDQVRMLVESHRHLLEHVREVHEQREAA